MKKFLLTFLALQIIAVINIPSQWVWQNPKPQGNDATDIKMFNSGTGYHKTAYSILKTTNFGTNWNIVHNDDFIGDIFFVNEQTGYHSKGTSLYKTTNEGNTWNLLTAFHGGEMTWLNETTGFVVLSTPVNSYPNIATKISRTTNGGSSWQELYTDTSITINCISALSSSVIFIGGVTKNPNLGKAKFIRSFNGGTSWDSIPIARLRNLRSVYFFDNNTGYISGEKFTNGPSMLKTINGGASWDSLYNTPIYKLHFVNLNTGYGGMNSLSMTTNAGVTWIDIAPHYSTGLYAGSYTLTGNGNIYICGSIGAVGYSSNNGTSWISNSSGYNFSAYDIKFFNSNTGIVTGERNNFGNDGILVRTTNGGATWDSTTIDAGLTKKIYIKDNSTAFIAGVGKIFKTTNRGETFTSYNTASNYRWDDISFGNENTGYVINKYSAIDKTTNGGVNWFNIEPFGGGSNYFTICFVNGNTGFYGGSLLYKTTNGGTSWDSVTLGNLDFHKYYIRKNNNVLYIMGNTDFGHTGIIAKSSDLGDSWSIDSISNEILFDISFSPNNTVYVTGQNKIYRSENNSPWAALNAYTDGGNNKFSLLVNFVSRDTGYIVTGRGGILKTTNGGGTPIGINIGSNEIPKNFNLYQNYPNPFNPTTIIEYSLPKSSLVTIKVYDILGRFVTELVNLEQAAGHHSIPFDGSRYASGVYFYSIETPGFIQSKKMVLLK